MAGRGRLLLVKLALASFAALCLTDVALTTWVIPDGVYVWRPLPPFGACTTSAQREWLDRQTRELAANEEPGPTRFDAELGWVPIAGARVITSDGLLTAYNSIGARSQREYTERPGPDVLRVACFGDSFTHGDEVSNADTWSEQLEHTHPRIEVLNFGVGGYGTDQALLRQRRNGLHGARVACMGLFLDNVGRNVNRYRPWYWPNSPSCVAKPRFVLVDGELELVPIPYATREELVEAVASGRVLEDLTPHEFWSAATRWPWTRHSSIARLSRGYFLYRERSNERWLTSLEDEPYNVSLALLTAFHRETLERGAQRSIVILFVGEAELARRATGGSRYWQTLAGDLAARGIETLDVSDALLDAWIAAGDRPQSVLFSGHHYSRTANGIVARELAKLLE